MKHSNRDVTLANRMRNEQNETAIKLCQKCYVRLQTGSFEDSLTAIHKYVIYFI